MQEADMEISNQTHFMKPIIILLLSLVFAYSTAAQIKYYTKKSSISFYSKALFENIEAHNKDAVSVLDAGTGQIEFSVLIKGFRFDNSLMQEHFNENYLESDKYPKSVFKGKIANVKAIDFSKDGTYTCTVNGMLTLHGVTKPVNSQAMFTIKNGNISAASEFVVKPADFNIKIPALVHDKVAKSVSVVVKVSSYQLLNSSR